MAQVIKFERRYGTRDFLTIQTYEYGVNKPFKTFSSAISKANKDFKEEVSIHLSEIGCKDITYKLTEDGTTLKVITLIVN